MKKKGSFNSIDSLLEEVKRNNLLRMITLAEKQLNPFNYHLSFEAKKRLQWLHLLHYEQGGNVTVAAKKIGITRQWLSELKNKSENRKRITKWIEDKILKVRYDSQNIWGKEKIARALKRDYGIKINPNTVNNYLHKHKKISPRISLKNSRAWKAKIAREN